MKYGPIVLLILGVLSAIVFGGLAVITFILMATSGGKIDGQEAGPFIGLGCCCGSVGGLMAIGGLIWLIAAQKK